MVTLFDQEKIMELHDYHIAEGARKDGLQQGLQQGRLEGRTEGLTEGTLQSIQNLIKNMGLLEPVFTGVERRLGGSFTALLRKKS